MTKAISKEKLKIWRGDIVTWANDTIWIPDSQKKQGIIKLKLWKYQEEKLREATKRDKNGKFKYSTVCMCWPKRNSKTFSATLILTWLFTCFYNTQGVVASNSRDQASSVLFDLFKAFIRHSPILLQLVGEENLLDKEVRLPQTESRVVVLSSAKASSWGYGIDVGAVDEIHAAPDHRGLYDILASQTGDRNGIILLPSSVSSKLNVLYELYELAKSGDDPTIYFDHVQNKQLSPLISKRWLKSREKQLLPTQFKMYHLNRWIDATENLFTEEMVNSIFTETYSLPADGEVLRQLGNKHATFFIIGAGLDRALPFSRHGDRTIWTTIARAPIDGQDHYWILNQKEIPFSSADGIKKEIVADYEKYGLHNAILEVYQAADIFTWASENYVPAELMHPTANTQIPAFTNLYQIISEGRLHGPYLPLLESELKSFRCDNSGPNPSFGHPPGAKIKDDTAYSLAWAVHSLRELPNAYPAYEEEYPMNLDSDQQERLRSWGLPTDSYDDQFSREGKY